MSEEKVIDVPIEQLQTFEGRCLHLYKIRSVDNKLIPFELTQSQEIMDDIIEEEFNRNLEENNIEEAKVIKLKCRQVGSTTYDAIRTLDELINVDMCNAITMAHNTDTTELIYDIIKRAYDNLPDAIIPTKDGEPLYTNEQGDPVSIKSKPTPKSYSGKRIAFEDNDSRSTIQTAGSKDDAIKGVTLNVLALSESANFPDLSTTLASGMPSLTHSGRKYISIESTANGVSGIGEDYYKLWNKSMQDWEDYKSGKTQTFQGFRPIFIPWYYIERYTKDLAGGKLTNIDQVDFGSPEGRKEFLEKEKRWTTEGVYNPLTEQMQVLTDEQLNWYRTMMKETAGYDYKKAMRYYPTTPEEAFVSSNHCFFDLTKLTELKTRYINGELPDWDVGEVDFNEDGHVVFKPQSDGYLKVWEHPDPNWENRYVIGIDVGRGYEDGDYTVIKVKDILTQKYVAQWKGRIDQPSAADIASMIGIYYNEALLVPESNLDTIVEIIKPDGLRPYIGEVYFNQSGSSVKWGYWTSGGNRNKMLDLYKEWLKDNRYGYEALPDIENVEQHITFVRHQTARGVKYEADTDCYDDIVLSNALCHMGELWWDATPKEYNPKNIIQMVKRPVKKSIRRFKQSQIGK